MNMICKYTNNAAFFLAGAGCVANSWAYIAPAVVLWLVSALFRTATSEIEKGA